MAESHDDELVAALIRLQDEAARGQLRALGEATALKRARVVENSVAFRIGTALLAACRSLRGLVALPGAFASAWRVARARDRTAPAVDAGPDHDAEELRRFMRDLPGRELAASHAASRRRLPTSLAAVRMAVVMDEFSRAAFGPECALRDLPLEGFESELEGFDPHLLLVESAWRGIDGQWRGKIHPRSPELLHLVDCCRRRGIPTVFWNKEDPAHFEHFIDAAREFDHVFTTDSGSIERYRQALGHDRVDLLLFACQPRVHNPLEHFERKNAACFAGSWYARYPQRAQDFRKLVDAVRPLLEIDIFDRNQGRGDPQFQFPPAYHDMIRGRLAYDEIARAYKGYKFAINVNTITRSPTMLARRVFELLASNTVVVSNSTPALESQLSGLVVHSAEPSTITHMLQPLVEDEDRYRRHRLHALREVLLRHTAAHRLSEICTVVLGRRWSVPEPRMVCVSHVSDDDAARRVLAAYRRQAWTERRLMLVVPEVLLPQAETWDIGRGADVDLVPESAAGTIQPALDWGQVWVACMDARDHYGQHYLTDLALATSYSPAGPIGKSRHHVLDPDGRVVLRGERVYVASADLLARASVIPAACLEADLLTWVNRQRGDAPAYHAGTAVDEYNYCLHGASGGERVVQVDA